MNTLIRVDYCDIKLTRFALTQFARSIVSCKRSWRQHQNHFLTVNQERTTRLYVISSFRRDVAQNCAPLGYYAASSGYFFTHVSVQPIGPIFIDPRRWDR